MSEYKQLEQSQEVTRLAETLPDPAIAELNNRINEAVASLVPELKLPDLRAAATTELAAVGTRALNDLTKLATESAPAAVGQVEVVKAALEGGRVLDTLSGMASLSKMFESVPGASSLTQLARQSLGAWAVKLGFEEGQATALLAALQKGDASGLIAPMRSLISGGVSPEQQALLGGVLQNFGLDPALVAGATGGLQRLMGR